MNSRYDNSPGKDAAMARTRQSRMQAEHSSNNQFVRKVQASQAKYAGKPPKLEEKSMHFDAYMCNNGEHAVELGRKLTKGLDKVAYPVK